MKTWGCSHNNSDGEYMAGQLAASGYKITGKDVFGFVLVTCGLRRAAGAVAAAEHRGQYYLVGDFHRFALR